MVYFLREEITFSLIYMPSPGFFVYHQDGLQCQQVAQQGWYMTDISKQPFPSYVTRPSTTPQTPAGVSHDSS